MAEIKEFPVQEETTVNTIEEVATKTDDETTMEQMDSLINHLRLGYIKSDLESKTETMKAHRDNLVKSVGADEDAMKDIEEQLKKFKTVKELQDYLNKGKENVERFFGGIDKIDVDFDNDYQKELDFKKGFLIYMKESAIAYENIDKEYEKLDESMKEFDQNMKEVTSALSDNILGYLSMMKDKADACENETTKKKLLTSIAYIESGYTYKIFSDEIDKHPTIVDHCVKELVDAKANKGSKFEEIGSRYLKKSQKYSKCNLISFISDYSRNVKSFEEYILVEDQYEHTDLFVYSMIRWFAMADWNDKNVKALHSSVAHVIKRIMDNTLDVNVKADVINAIVDYLKKFNK